MAENEGTLNESGGQSADTGASSTPMASEGDLVPTVEIGIETIPEGDPSSDPDAKGEGSQEGAPEAKTGGEDEGDGKPKEGEGAVDDLDTRFDKHPRFVELNEKVKALGTQNADLQRQLQEQQKQPPGGEGSEKLPFKDISEMEDEAVLEWQQDDPKGYYANVLAQAKHEVGNDLAGRMDERNYETQIEHTFTEFAKQNPDFDEMWDRGELQRFMNTHPGHNAISAYRELTFDQRLDEGKKEAVAEAEKKFNEGLKTKRESQTLSSGPAASGGGTVAGKTPPELQDTKKFGGLTTVLAKRSADRIKKMRGGG
jgi:hypothetical protein